MFALFRSPAFEHPALGTLRRKAGMWRGSTRPEGRIDVPLILPGGVTQPDPASVALVQELASVLPEWRSSIAAALFGHLEPYAQADDDSAFAHVRLPEDVWPHVRLCHVSVFELSGMLTLELGYEVDWDEEHTLGARFQQGKLVELNGSTAPL